MILFAFTHYQEIIIEVKIGYLGVNQEMPLLGNAFKMLVFPTRACQYHDPDPRPHSNPANHYQNSHPEPGRCRPLSNIVSLDFSALLRRRSHVRIVLGRPNSICLYRSRLEDCDLLAQSWWSLFGVGKTLLVR